MFAYDDSRGSAWIAIAFAVLFVCALLATAVSPFQARAYASDASALKERMAALESDISSLEAERDALGDEIKSLASSLEEVESSLQAARDSESEYRQSGYDSMVALYKIENSPVMLIDMLLDSSSLDDALTRIKYFETVRKTCVDNIDEIKAELEVLEEQKAELAERQASAKRDQEDKSSRIEQAQAELETVQNELDELANNPGRRIAAAAVALAGCQSDSNTAPGPANYYGKTARTGKNAKTPPPRVCSQGDWSIYLDVFSEISNGTNVPNHACCDCLPVLAVLWSGVDDGYLNGMHPTYNREFSYLTNSPKWDRVGGNNAYWYRNPPGGVNEIELQPGDILATNNPSKDSRHWMVYVGHEIAANRWGDATPVDCVDEAYRSRWANGKPLSSRKDAKWAVFRRNTVDYNPDASRWADFMKTEKERYIL